MLQWRGGGRTLAHDPAPLHEIGYLQRERASIYEFLGCLERDEADRLAWEWMAQQRGVLDALAVGPTKSRGATEHWKPPRTKRYELGD